MQPPVAATHETPWKELALAPDGVRIVWITQLVPFHASANPLSAVVTARPTAVQAVAEMQDTLESELPVAPVGFGVDWIDHAVPFQDSARDTVVPVLLTKLPTASHAVAVLHETPENELAFAPAGTGVDWMTQVIPFQCSARAVSTPELLTE
jgi:hypothetical protein